jgi:hypothetical protein
MDETNTAILYEAYQRLHSNGPEYGGDERGDNGLTNHGPMAAEVMCRRDLGVNVHRWLDRYTKRLTELPGRTEPITGTNWQRALGAGRERVGDWTAYFTRELAERPWREVLTDWWSRLLPGIAAGSTHGVIRASQGVERQERPILRSTSTTRSCSSTMRSCSSPTRDWSCSTSSRSAPFSASRWMLRVMPADSSRRSPFRTPSPPATVSEARSARRGRDGRA